MELDFTVNGKQIHLTDQSVVDKLRTSSGTRSVLLS